MSGKQLRSTTSREVSQAQTAEYFVQGFTGVVAPSNTGPSEKLVDRKGTPGFSRRFVCGPHTPFSRSMRRIPAPLLCSCEGPRVSDGLSGESHTPPLRWNRRCSWSARPGSNRRPSAWEEKSNPRKINELRVRHRREAATRGNVMKWRRHTAPWRQQDPPEIDRESRESEILTHPVALPSRIRPSTNSGKSPTYISRAH
jgi:hypothetical protein